MKLEDAPKVLNKKYYSKYRGKEVNEYEWIVLNREGRGEEWGKKKNKIEIKIKPLEDFDVDNTGEEEAEGEERKPELPSSHQTKGGPDVTAKCRRVYLRTFG